MKLEARTVEKPWGRTALPVMLGGCEAARPIGEIWFAAPDGGELPLLVKHIFTGERLSIQVHPDDIQARARGLPNGKTECWYILEAEPGAELGLGLTRAVSAGELRAAALDGSIETLLAWRPVRAGDFFYVPAGTIHAIGGGLSLIEVQQVSDVTYRLYDYGRPRELHLEDGVAVATAGPYPEEHARHVEGGSVTLVDGPHFTLLRVDGRSAEAKRLAGRDRLAMPLDGRVRSGGEDAGPGECLLVSAGTAVEADGAYLLAAAGSFD